MYSMILRDVLHVASERVVRSESDRRYAKGVIVGIVAGLMSTGLGFNDALNRATLDMPEDLVDGVMPLGWK